MEITIKLISGIFAIYITEWIGEVNYMLNIGPDNNWMTLVDYEIVGQQLTRLRKEREQEEAFRDNFIGLGAAFNEHSKAGKREIANDRALSLLQMRLQDPAYQAAYDALGNELTQARQHSREARQELDHLLARNREQQQAMIDQACKLPDGKAAFLSRDGRTVIDQDERVLSPEQAAQLPRNELLKGPRAESYQAVRAQDRQLVQEEEKLNRYDRRLEEIDRTRNSGKLSREELQALRSDIRDEAPDRVRSHWPRHDQDESAEQRHEAASPDRVSAASSPKRSSAATELTGDNAFPHAPRMSTDFGAAMSPTLAPGNSLSKPALIAQPGWTP